MLGCLSFSLDAGNLLGICASVSCSLESLLLSCFRECLLLLLLLDCCLLQSFILSLGLNESSIRLLKLLKSSLFCLRLGFESLSGSLNSIGLCLHPGSSLLLHLKSHVSELTFACLLTLLGPNFFFCACLLFCLGSHTILHLFLSLDFGLVSSLSSSCLHGLLTSRLDGLFLLSDNFVDNVAVASWSV